MTSTYPKLSIEGHRGYRPLENSKEGFEKCLSLPISGIETDLWLMKDNNILIHHGHTPLGLIELKHTETNRTHKIYAKNLTREDLSLYVDQHTGTRLILLEDFLGIAAKRPDLYLNLEIKDPRREAVESILELLTRAEPPNPVKLSSFFHSVKTHLEELEKEFPVVGDIGFGFLVYNLDALYRLLPFFGRILLG